MSAKSIILILLLGFIGISQGKNGFHGNQEWGFVSVRPGATMFYWLHYTTSKVAYTSRPLLIWLQGGPGVSSTAYGNFEEIGPFYRNMTRRESTLIKDYNVLFIDSPVGTGYSYVNSSKILANTDKQVASDLLRCIHGFLTRFSRFSKVPTYIIGESYGGKSATMLAYLWSDVVKRGWKYDNLKGVGLVDPWISPVDTVLSWAPYLFQNGFVDSQEYGWIMSYAHQTRGYIKAQYWKRATNNEQLTLRTIISAAKNLDTYNILNKVKGKYEDPFMQVDRDLKTLMETKVKRALNLPNSIHFSNDNDKYAVKKALEEDFMKPVTEQVEYLLNNTNLKVFVLNGQLDFIVNTPGTLHWIEELSWRYAYNWFKTEKQPLLIDNVIEGYVKAFGNLSLYWVHRAGHMLPVDNPAAMKRILRELTRDG